MAALQLIEAPRLSASLPAHGALVGVVALLATEIGRLRRHPACAEGSSLEYLSERLAGHIETLDCILQPSAAELHQAGDTIQDALAITDRHAYRLRSVLMVRQPW